MGMFGNLLGAKRQMQMQPDQPGMGMGDMGIIQAPDQPQHKQDDGLRTFENTPGWQVMLGGLFDGLAQMGGMKPTFIPQLQQNRQRQWEMSKMAQQQGLEYQRQMALKQYEVANKNPYRFQDNAGNMWQIGQDGQPSMFFVDKAPKQQLVSDGMGGYHMVSIPNPYNPQGAPNALDARQPMAELPQGYTIRGAAPTVQAKPTVIDRAGYQAMRASMGPQGVNAWMAKNNVIVGGY